MAKMTPLLVMTLFTLMTLMIKTAGNPTHHETLEGQAIEHRIQYQYHSGKKQYSLAQTENPIERKKNCKKFFARCKQTIQCCSPFVCQNITGNQLDPVPNNKRDTNPNPNPNPKPKPKPKPDSKPKPKPKPKPDSKPKPKPKPKPDSKPKPKPKSKPDSNPKPKPKPKPDSNPKPKPKSRTVMRCSYPRTNIELCKGFFDPCRKDEECCDKLECRKAGAKKEKECLIKPEFDARG